MNVIVATDRLWGIGKDGNIPWHISEDMKFFKKMTTGKVVIMGRKTMESFPNKKPLPNRVNIVLTKNPDYTCDGAIVVHSVEELLEKTKDYDDEDLFVIGGGQIYNLLMSYCGTAYVTRIDKVFDTDAKFPNLYSMKCWEETSVSEFKEENGIRFNFCTFKHSFK